MMLMVVMSEVDVNLDIDIENMKHRTKVIKLS